MTTTSDEMSDPNATGPAGARASGPHEMPPTGWRDILIRLKDVFGAHHVTLSAAGVSFFAFGSLLPFLALIVSSYALVADPADIVALADRLGDVAPGEVATFVSEQLSSIADSSGSSLSVGAGIAALLALWSASSAMGHLMEALNVAYEEDVDDRPFWIRRLVAIALTIGMLVLVAVSGLAVTLSSGRGVLEPAGWAVVAVLALVAVAALYRYSTDRREPKWRWVTPGAVVAVLGWLLVSVGFRFYVANFGSYNETYGSIGAIVVLLTWLYLSTIIVIVGAEINAATELQTRVDSTRGPARPIGQRGAVVADRVLVDGDATAGHGPRR